MTAVGGCRRGEGRAGAEAGPMSSASASASTSTSTSTSTARGCEAFAQRGAVREGNALISQGDGIRNGSVLDVVEGGEVTIRTAMYREITIGGPARAVVCPDGEDGILLSRGRVSAAPG